MEKVDVLTIPVYKINKSSINTKSSPVKSSSNVPASQTKIGFIKSQSIYPKSNGTYSTTQILNPQSEANTSRDTKIAQLNLNCLLKGQHSLFKENRSSREKIENGSKENLMRIDDSKRTNLTFASENLIKKISTLQVKIKELSKEKQQISKQMNNKINILDQQNKRLTNLIRNSCKETTPDFKHQSKVQFNLEDMLSVQININLQLRETIQKMQQQMTIRVQKFAELQNSLAILEIKNKESIQEQQRGFDKEKQKILFDSQCKTKEIQQLKAQIISLTTQLSKEKFQAEYLREKSSESAKQQCKKCKDLLHTIFRLNNQLNKQ